MRIQVAWALPHTQQVIELDVASGTTAREVLQLVREQGLLAGVDRAGLALGVFGEVVELTYQLQAGDRLELYRPLPIDPKEARRRRAAEDAEDAEP